jgi:hypothetical protein
MPVRTGGHLATLSIRIASKGVCADAVPIIQGAGAGKGSVNVNEARIRAAVRCGGVQGIL